MSTTFDYKNISRIRNRHNETQSQLGEAITISQDSISKIENGNTLPKIDTLIDIAKHYNISLDELCMVSGENIYLDTLNSYINLSYKTCSYGEETYFYPVLSIKKSFYRYIQQSAYAKSLPLPKEVEDMWLKKENTIFLESMNNDKEEAEETVELVLVPEPIICPSEEDVYPKQEEILHKLSQQRNELSSRDDETE